MATETLLPDSATGWPTGAVTDIDEGVATPDGNVMATTATDDVLLVGFAASAIEDADTVNSITVRIRGLTTGSGNDRFECEVLIGGIGQGGTNGSPLGASHGNEDLTNAGWDSDWTAAELDGITLTIGAGQTGMPATVGHELDCVELIIDYTPAPSGRVMSSQADQGGLVGSGGLAGEGGGLAGCEERLAA